MANLTLAPVAYQTVLDANGNPVAGAKITTYVAGTTTLATTYTDQAGATPNANPIVADAAGRFVAYVTPGASYKFAFADSTGASIRTQDNIPAVPASAINLDVTGTAGEGLTAGEAVYLSDGSGGKTAGSWYGADSAQTYSSVLPVVGMATAVIASGSSGTIRIGGQPTGLSALVIGTTYYVGTAGAVTSTAPTNRRVIGVADTTSSLIMAANPAPPLVDVSICEGRLTLTTGTPVTTADVTAATTLYFTPYKGNRIALFDGTNWVLRSFAELSIAVPATTSQMYDVWAYDNAGVTTLELLAWTNDTTRATALATQDGVYVKTGATTRRYLGSFRTTAVSGQTEDSLAKRLVSNYANRVRRPMRVLEATDSWNYTTATWRQANGATGNQLAMVIGVAEVPIDVTLQAHASNTNAGVAMSVAVKADSTTTPTFQFTSIIGTNYSPVAAYIVPITAHVTEIPPVGYHFYAWLEFSAATGTTTWYGDNGGATAGPSSGLLAVIEG
jgi:hypothetical protein